MTEDDLIAAVAADDPAMAAVLRDEKRENDAFERSLATLGTPAYRNLRGETEEEIAERIKREYP